jgi:SAM-dependent methyltransferase
MTSAAKSPEYARDYYLTREHWLDWRVERDHLIGLARPTPCARVLEVGPGAGGLSLALAARGARMFAVETARAGLEILRRRLPEAGVALVSEKRAGLPFAEASFDALVAQHVIEHLADPETAVSEWRRVLAPGARAAVATPNAHYPDPAHFADPHHVRVFSAEELAALFAGADFWVETVYTLFPYLPRFPGRGRVSALLSGLFRRLPHFSARGRTLMLAARRPRSAPEAGTIRA